MQQMLKTLSEQQNIFFEYCIKLSLIDGQQRYLTTAAYDINAQNQRYKANSGIKILQIINNEGGQNSIKLQLAPDYSAEFKHLINSTIDLKIFFTQTSKIYDYNIFFITKVHEDSNNNLLLDAQPITMKLQQNLLSVYSKTCRAIFGDDKCKIDAKIYSFDVEIMAINGRELILKHINQDSGYFNNGKLILPLKTEELINQSLQSISLDKFDQCYITIIKHINNVLILEKTIPMQYKDLKNITIVAGCDKNFVTCCNKFNNAINFRGEPCIPSNQMLT